MEIALIADIFNIVLSFFLIIISVRLVLRTERELDTVAKFFAAASITLFLATVLEANVYIGSMARDISFVACNILYTLAIAFFGAGGYILYGIASDKGK